MDVQISQEVCCNDECGVIFWIPEELRQRLVSTKRSFYCPNGHSMSYQGESDKSKIARLEQEKNRILRESNTKILELRVELEKKCKKKKK